MNKCLKIFVILSIFSIVLSCGGRGKKEVPESAKITNLDELKRKYVELTYEDCDQFLSIGDEMMEVYVKTIDKAFDGNLSAKDDLENFDSFMSRFDTFYETMEAECPEKFEKWSIKIDSIMEEYEYKLISIFRDENISYEWDDELQIDIEQQVVELNEELLRLEQSDSLYAE